MLRTIHKYRKSLLGILLISCIILVMTGFGIDFFQGNERGRSAIQVDDTKISHQQFQQKRQQHSDLLQQRFGPDYWRIVQAIGLDINKQVADSIINEKLLTDEVKRLGFDIGDSELRAAIEDMFPEGFSMAAYRQMLLQSELNNQQFEEELRSSLLIQAFEDFIRDTSAVSKREALALLKREETLYDLRYVKVSAADLKTRLEQPDDQELSAFYELQVLDFEQPAKVEYRYLPFEPASFIDQVEVSQEDLELHYVDNQNEFSTPEKVRISQIELRPSEQDGGNPEDLASLAKEIFERASTGEEFATLALKYSHDVETKTKGGFVGWVERGQRSGDFDKYVFAKQEPGLVEPFKIAEGYLIVKVEQYQPQQLLPLEQVKDQIAEQIRNSLAPAYARDRAEIALVQLEAKEAALQEIAGQHQLTVGSSSGLLSSSEDPAGWRGLTRKVIDGQAGNTYQLIEIKDATILVEVVQFKESFVPAFSELADLKERLIENYLMKEAKQMASDLADGIVGELQDPQSGSLLEVAELHGLSVHEEKGLKASANLPEALNHPEVKKAIFSSAQKGSSPPIAVPINGDFVVLQVTDLTVPSAETLAEEIEQYRKQAQQTVSDLVLRSTINRLKAQSKIEIDPALLIQPELD